MTNVTAYRKNFPRFLKCHVTISLLFRNDLTENSIETDDEEESEDEDESVFKKIVSVPMEYYKNLTNPQTTKSDDVYKYMFLCDFLCFIIIIFGFSAFGVSFFLMKVRTVKPILSNFQSREGDGGVLSYVEDNVVPPLFLWMLITQFILMVIDRGLYLRKCYQGKVIFQYFLIVGLHVWMFFILPATTVCISI